MTRKINIAIIGVGLAGTAVFSALVKNFEATRLNAKKFNISLIEKTGIFGPGVAYGTSHQCNLINTPTDEMGIIFENKQKFNEWLSINKNYIKKGKGEINTQPRFVYGEYLKQTISENIEKCMEIGVNVQLISKEIIDINIVENEYRLIYDDLCTGSTDYIVLCMGGIKSTFNKEFHNLSNYFDDPYDDKMIDCIKKSPGVVGIAGTSLSAIDSILMLNHDEPYNDKIFCFSKSGRIPCVRSTEQRIAPRYLTKKVIDQIIQKNGELKIMDIFNLLKREVLDDPFESDFSFLIKDDVDEISRLTEEMKKSEKLRYWQAVLYNTNDVLNYIWINLDIKNQAKILYDFHSHFLKYRAAMPLETGKILLKLMQTKKVSLKKITKKIKINDNNEFIINLNGQVIIAKYLINATGFENNITKTENTLLKNMMKKGIIDKNMFNGIRLDAKKINVVDQNDIVKNNFFAIGAITTGEFFITNLAEHCVWHAELITKHLLKNAHLKIINELSVTAELTHS